VPNILLASDFFQLNLEVVLDSLTFEIKTAKFAYLAKLGSKKAGVSSDFWKKCMILKKISIGKRPFIALCQTR
jgi:hypothetical protein